MNDSVLARLIHSTPTKAVIYTTGGGSAIFPTLLEMGGGSNTLLSGMIPYDQQESTSLMGGVPDKMVSAESARILAMAAYERAVEISSTNDVIGIGATSKLQMVPSERIGRHHAIHVALQTAEDTVSMSLELNDPSELIQGSCFSTWVDIYPASTRRIEEHVNTLMILNMLASGCGLKERVKFPYSLDKLVKTSQAHYPQLADLMRGTKSVIGLKLLNGQVIVSDSVPSKGILSSSINPIHDGHWDMLKVGESILSTKCDIELTLKNANKPRVDFISLRERIDSVLNSPRFPESGMNLWITRSGSFAEKSNLFPNTTFLIGTDTALRIEKCVGSKDMDSVWNDFYCNNSRFLVFPRGGELITPSKSFLLSEDFCRYVTDFHSDLSSSAIREQQKVNNEG